MSSRSSTRPAPVASRLLAFALVLSALFTLILVSRLLLPGAMEEFIDERNAPNWVRTFLVIHIAGGIVALVAGCWNMLAAKPGTHAGRHHRLIGRLYLGAICVGGSAALAIGGYVPREWNGHVGVALLGISWLVSAWNMQRSARSLDLARHRRWAIRSLALTLAAASLRAQLIILMLLVEQPMTYYGLVLWSCWLPNLLLAELLIRKFTPAMRRPIAGA